MHNSIFERPLKTGMQIISLLAILVLNLAPGGVRTAYALGNDNFANAKVFTDVDISYRDPLSGSLDVSSYSTETNEPAPPAIPAAPYACSQGNTGNHDVGLGFRTAWYKFTPGIARLVSFDTIGSDYDTYITVWSSTVPNPNFSDLSFVDCNDDTSAGFQSKVSMTIPQAAVDNGTTYYIQVANYSCDYAPPDPPCTSGTPEANPHLVFHANLSNIEVTVGGPTRGTYYLTAGDSQKAVYNPANAGPLLITSKTADQLIASMRVIQKVNTKNVSYSELMGFPADQATTDYYFPWYTTNSSTNSQLRIVNVGNQTTTVAVHVGVNKTIKGSYSLAPGTSKLVVYSSLNSGPVWVSSRIGSAPGSNIIVSMRVLYKYSGVITSYSELMGFPSNQLSTEYLFPWYKTASGLTSQLRVANVDDQATTVQVYIAGLPQGAPISLGVGAAKQIAVYTGVNKGPVRVVSTNPDASIIASMKQTYKGGSIPQSYSEMMGYPKENLTTEYQFPWYNNTSIVLSSLRIVNVDDFDATSVNVYIGSNLQTPISLAAGESSLVSYALIPDEGPVRVVSTNSAANILVSMQITYKQSGKAVSYSEFTGIPYFGSTTNTAYLFPWYANTTTLKSELRFGYP